MFVQVVVYTTTPEQAATFARTVAELAAASRAEAGCLEFKASRGEDGTTFVLYEEWRDDAALEAHYATEHFQRLGINGIRKLAASRTAYKTLPL